MTLNFTLRNDISLIINIRIGILIVFPEGFYNHKTFNMIYV